MSIVVYKDGGVSEKINPYHLEGYLKDGWRLTKEAPKKRGPKKKVVEVAEKAADNVNED